MPFVPAETMAATPKDQTILIVGGGTFGLSTALHLARRGYTNVTVLDPHPIPSALSAGNDVNKTVDGGNLTSNTEEGYVGSRLFEASIKGWREDPVFQAFYHETGFICAASSPEGEENVVRRQSPNEAAPGSMTRLDTAEDFKALMPKGALTGDFPGWRGWYKNGSNGSGWVEARNAMQSAFHEAQKLNVRFMTGSQDGDVVELCYEGGDVTGVRTRSGRVFEADCVILAAGARSSEIFEFGQQLLPKCWTLAHIKLEPHEIALYRDIPVMSNIERGFFIPDLENGELKICNEFPGYTNFVVDPKTGKKASIALHRHDIPVEAEERLRSYLRECMPHLAERPFTFARICWCTDTPDRTFLIGRHPTYRQLLLATGDSGRGFMHIPAIGKFIADAMEGELDPIMAKAWKWRPETATNRDLGDRQGRMGGLRRPQDLSEVNTWSQEKPKSAEVPALTTLSNSRTEVHY